MPCLEPRGRNETARVHIFDCRRDNLAAWSTRATAKETANNWYYRSEYPGRFPPIRRNCGKPLSELGWTVGHDVIVEYRYTETSVERTGEFAAEFARMQVNAITVFGDTEALTVKRAASKIQS
jgi:hypothetical protein